jgi:selenocysteine-specific elongation factor
MSPAKTRRDIVPVMIGTAGHVDHGKSALVEALTGCAMDRHPEAKARGLTIDLGFAACELPGRRLAGIIDVPGHEDFIRNMVAGAAGMDVLMLVVAADDGVMPQTREHLGIVRALRTPRVMAVVTKIDLVEPAWVELVRGEVGDLLAEAGLGEAPVLPASSVTFQGLDSVRTALYGLVEAVDRPPDPRAFRMPVERSFTVKGRGTVVTGIPASGLLQPEEEAELLPAATRHTVRAVQTYRIDAEAARAGACAAVNLRDLAPEAVGRGMHLAAPGIYRATTTAVVRVEALEPRYGFKRTSRVRFHAGTGCENARLKLLDAEALSAGERANGRIDLEGAMTLAAGDRFILRSLTPAATVAGGIVLAVREGRLRQSAPALADRLRQASEAAASGDVLTSELLAGGGPLVEETEVLRLSQCTGAAAREKLESLVADGVLLPLGGWYLVKPRLEEIARRFESALSRFHQAHPGLRGMEPAAAAGLVGLPASSFPGLSRALAPTGRFAVRHGRLAKADFAPALTEKQMAWREAILEALNEAGIRSVASGDLRERLGIPKQEMKRLTRMLVEEGEVVAAGTHLVRRGVHEEVREKLLALLEAHGMVDLNAFREATGASRNVAVALLEGFDSEGLTRRTAEGRVRRDAEGTP